MKYDLHIHSKYSEDGFLKPKKIVEIALKKGLGGIAITDHNTIKGALEAKKYQNKKFRVIIGEEIDTERGEIMGLFLKKGIKPGKAKDVIRKIKKQKGVIVLPHPFDKLRHSTFKFRKDDIKFIDAIEIFNSRCVFDKYNQNAEEFAKKHKLAVTAGSDAHLPNEIGNAGIITNNKNIKEAIFNKETKIFGKKSFILNHALTKTLKIWRRFLKSSKKY